MPVTTYEAKKVVCPLGLEAQKSFVGAGDEPKRHIVLAGKRKIVGVDDVTDEEEYNKVKDMTPFEVEVDTSILLAQRGGSLRTS